MPIGIERARWRPPPRALAALALASWLWGGCTGTEDRGRSQGSGATDEGSFVESSYEPAPSEETGEGTEAGTDPGTDPGTETEPSDTGAPFTPPTDETENDGCLAHPGDGFEVGDVLPDFALTDQFGDTVHLRDYCDRTILLIGSAFW